MDEHGMGNIRSGDLFAFVIEPEPDWHTFKHFHVTRQAQFFLEAAENQREYELAMHWARLKGQDPLTIPHTRYTDILQAAVEDDDCRPFPTRPASESRYDIEEALFRDRVFSHSPSELTTYHALRRTAWRQIDATGSYLIRLDSLDRTLAQTFEATRHYLKIGAPPVACFRAAYEGFEQFVRRTAGNHRLYLVEEAALTSAFPVLAHWVRDYIIEVAIHAEDEQAFVPEIQRDRYFLLFLMAAAALVLLRPAEAWRCYPLFEMPFEGEVEPV